MSLTTEEKVRYSRHLNLPQFGLETQEQLKDSKVLVVGTGGLGAPLLQYLCAAGIGTIGVVDFDVVDESNLQRQVLFSVDDLGKSKSSVAIQKLSRQNPHVKFEEYNLQLNSTNALEIIAKYDVIADGTDNFPTRYLTNDACVLLNKPLIYGSIYQFEGQVSVFNYQGGPNYRDLFPVPPPPGMVPSCAEGGVLGVLPGIIGSLQGLEVIKVVTGIGETLSGRLYLFDALEFEGRTVKIRKDPANPINGENSTIKALIDYEEFCGLKKPTNVQGISVEEFYNLKTSGEDFILIDVREQYEFEVSNLGGKLIPKATIEENLSHIAKEGKVILHCKSGKRSADVIELLQTKYDYQNLLNLKGGIEAWKKKYDPDLQVV